MSKPVKIGNRTFDLDSVCKVMTMSEPLTEAQAAEVGLAPGTRFKAIISGVGPFQAAGLCFAQVGMDTDENAPSLSSDPPCQYLKIVSVLPAKLDHWAEVESSQIAAIAYDWLEQRLRVRFHGRVKKDGLVTPGSTYSYEDVPAAVVGEMLFAPSVGVAFGVLVKNGGYRFERVTE